jgi:hypothetical protein
LFELDRGKIRKSHRKQFPRPFSETEDLPDSKEKAQKSTTDQQYIIPPMNVP